MPGKKVLDKKQQAMKAALLLKMFLGGGEKTQKSNELQSVAGAEAEAAAPDLGES